jgi:hypothetical protein
VKPLTVRFPLIGRRFSSDEDAIGAVQNWLKTQPIFSDGIKKTCEKLESLR